MPGPGARWQRMWWVRWRWWLVGAVAMVASMTALLVRESWPPQMNTMHGEQASVTMAWCKLCVSEMGDDAGQCVCWPAEWEGGREEAHGSGMRYDRACCGAEVQG